MTRTKLFFKHYFPRWVGFAFGVGALGGILLLLCRCSAPFADFFNRQIASIFRTVLAYATGWIPFSLAETVILCLPLGILLYIFYCFSRRKSLRFLWRQVFSLAGILCLLSATFTLNYAPGYHGRSLAEKLELSANPPTAEELYDVCEQVFAEMNALEPQICRARTGESEMPYTFQTLVKKLNAAYDRLYDEYAFLSPLHAPVKPIALSRALTYTHMAGFYTFWSGEANVNTNYPDYVNVYSAAHEMAHQRGIAPEDEANFIAFLACDAADDPYIRYCGYTGLFDYLSEALYRADPALAGELTGQMTGSGYARESDAYSVLFAPYRDSVAATVSDAINDAYLKAQGEAAGSVSYGLVVDLAVAYFHR